MLHAGNDGDVDVEVGNGRMPVGDRNLALHSSWPKPETSLNFNTSLHFRYLHSYIVRPLVMRETGNLRKRWVPAFTRPPKDRKETKASIAAGTGCRDSPSVKSSCLNARGRSLSRASDCLRVGCSMLVLG